MTYYAWLTVLRFRLRVRACSSLGFAAGIATPRRWPILRRTMVTTSPARGTARDGAGRARRGRIAQRTALSTITRLVAVTLPCGSGSLSNHPRRRIGIIGLAVVDGIALGGERAFTRIVYHYAPTSDARRCHLTTDARLGRKPPERALPKHPRYRTITDMHERRGRGRGIATELRPIDLASIARSLGAMTMGQPRTRSWNPHRGGRSAARSRLACIWLDRSRVSVDHRTHGRRVVTGHRGPRIQPVDPARLNPDQQEVFDRMVGTHGRLPARSRYCCMVPRGRTSSII